MTTWLNTHELHRIARRRLPRAVSDFIDGGAEDERTLAANRRSFERCELVPRVLTDVSRIDLTRSVCGTELSLPVLLAPVGLSRLIGPGGDVAAAAAARRTGTVAVISSASSDRLADVARAAGPQWFQLYPWVDRGLTGALMDLAWEVGYRTLCLTVDVPVLGARERDVRNGFGIPLRPSRATLPDVLRHPRWWWRRLAGSDITVANLETLPGRGSRGGTLSFAERNAELNDPSVSWEDAEWIRQRWDGPAVVKGVMHPGDARAAQQLGFDGIIVSNHGGRQLDGAPATLDVLPAIREAVGRGMDLLLDGGVRRGADVVRAVALGADAVLIGRPWLWALAVDGQAGIERLLTLLRAELTRVLALTGCTSIGAVDEDVLWPPGSLASRR